MIDKNQKYYLLQFESDQAGALALYAFWSEWEGFKHQDKLDNISEFPKELQEPIGEMLRQYELRKLSTVNPESIIEIHKRLKIPLSIISTVEEYDEYVAKTVAPVLDNEIDLSKERALGNRVLITEKMVNFEHSYLLDRSFAVYGSPNWSIVSPAAEQESYGERIKEIEQQKEEAAEKEIQHEKELSAERDRIMANMAHSIKNLISSVQAPLNSVSKDDDIDEYNKVCVRDALKGLELIKEIAFAIDHSYTGSIDDFRSDAICKKDEGEALQLLIFKSLIHAATNMFDIDYFENPSFNYFPKEEKEKRNEALKEYQRILNEYDVDEISDWLNKYFFKFSYDVDITVLNRLKDTKSSAMKFFIMMQEILMNAIKYASYVPEEKRFLLISLKSDKENIVISVKNSMKKVSREKTTGKGNLVIAKFAQILGTEPEINKLPDDGIYEVKISFENFWLSEKAAYTQNENPKFLKVSEKINDYKA